MKKGFIRMMGSAAIIVLGFISCSKDSKPGNGNQEQPKNPDLAETVSVDRFSDLAGHLQVRSVDHSLPAANQPINFDQAPFITKGLTPTGHSVDYYNFDVQDLAPAPIYSFFRKDKSTPVPNQLNIINVLPGETGYNDFWQVFKVIVPDDYVANTVTSFEEIAAHGFTVEKTNMLVNCPVVPKGSTATKRAGSDDKGLTRGWYKDKVVYYFNFAEKALLTTDQDKVPIAGIFVSFTINPDQPNGGPASGFKTETGSTQTHNVISALPTEAGYSPLWQVIVYNNTEFGNVMDLNSASHAMVLLPNAGFVNCPVVNIYP